MLFIKQLLILFFLFFSIDGYAKDKWFIKDITFSGLHKFSKKNICNYIKKYHGEKISFNSLNKVIYNLLQTGQFENIKVVKFKNNLIFKIKEQSGIYRINFSDGMVISNDVIKTLLNNNIKIGNSLNLYYLNSFKNILKKYYFSIGKYNVDIKSIFFIQSDKKVYFKILILERKSAVVNNINIFGNYAFSSNKIISLLRLYNRSNIWFFIDKKDYLIKKFNEDLKNIKNFYLQKGYIFFKFSKIHVVFSLDKKKVDVNIFLKEGSRYCISNLFFHGNVLSYYKKINSIIYSISKKHFDYNDILKLKKIIKNMFFCDGYPNVNVSIYFKKNIYNDNLDCYLYIYPNQRFILNKINFVGNKFSTNNFLHSKIKHKEGDWFNILLLIQGRKDLLETGFFKDVKLNFYNFNNESKKINAVYTIQENDIGNINLGFGYGMDSGINLNLNITRNHLFNTGSKFQLSILKDMSQTSGSLIFRYPFLNMFQNNLKGQLFYNYFKFNEIDSTYYQNKRYGLDTILGFLINEKNEFNIGIHYVHNNISNIESPFSIWRYFKSLKSNYKKYNTDDILMSFFWIFNNLHHENYNLFGNYTILSGKCTILGSDNHFNKIKLESREYFQFKFNKNFTLFARTYLGFGNSNNINEEFPFYENYHAGGIGSIRGFKFNSIGPKDIYYNKYSNFCIGKQFYKFCQSDISTGGNAIINTNLELIKKILLNDNYKLSVITASVFLDSTTVWNTHWINSLDSKLSHFSDYSNPYDIRISTGIALQWISPLGPLNFSYSYPLKYNDKDKIESFQFNIGKIW
ncbi:Outer membrane protein assembly factor BamA [Buchnera aphidicola (Pemphigus immunis)]